MKKLLLLALSFIFVACQTIQSKSTVIDDPGCNLPCWKGITPGKTNIQELHDLLVEIPLVDVATIVYVGDPDGYYSDIARCYIVESNSKTRIEIYLVNDIVTLVSLDYIKGDWNLALEDAINRLGEPERILIINYGNDIFINLVSPANGIAFGYNTIDKPSWWRTQIDPQNKVGWIEFFDPNMFTELMNRGELSFGILYGQEAMDSLQSWTGYGSIEEKYR